MVNCVNCCNRSTKISASCSSAQPLAAPPQHPIGGRPAIHCMPQGVKLHCIVDACHSGSMLDLPQTAVVAGGHAEWERCVVPRPDKGTSGGFAVLFSACQDNQAASDTAAFSGELKKFQS